MRKSFLFLVVCAGYYLLGHGGLHLATINQYASPIWPAAGFGIGASLLFGNLALPALFLGSFFLNAQMTSSNLVIPCFIAFGATLQAFIGAITLRKIRGSRALKDYSDIVSVLTSAVVSCAASATISTVSLLYFGEVNFQNFSYAWYTWWSGDAVGVLMVLPLVLELGNPSPEKVRPLRIVESYCIGMLCLSLLYFTFRLNLNQAFLWLGGPVLILIGLRSGRLYASIILLIISAFVSYLTILGLGPFQYGNTNRNLIYIQTLVTCFSISVLFVKQMKIAESVNKIYVVGMSTGIIAVFSLTYFTTYYENKNTLADYQRITEAALNAISKTTGLYDVVLKSASGVFAVTNEVTQAEWKQYIESTHLNFKNSSMQGLGFIFKVKGSELKEFEKKHKLKVKTYGPYFPTPHDERFIITYIEPFEPNQQVTGLDIGSERRRRAAALMAKNQNQTIGTEAINLVQDNTGSKGFLVYHPAFNQEQEFVGWVYAPFRSPVFFGKAFDDVSESLRIKVTLHGEEIFGTFSENLGPFRQDQFYQKHVLEIFGNKHLIEFYPTDLFFRRHSDYSLGIPFLLNLFLLFVVALVIEQISFGFRAGQLVQERTKELEASKMQLVESSKMASLGEMASGMAHEINNPLTIIQGKIQVISMILRELRVEDKLLFLELNKIKNTTDRIEKIVKGLRNFSRPSNQDPFELTHVKKIMTETLDLCSEKIRAEGIKLTVQEIPEVYLKCRPSQISQVLLNLLNNSRDAVQDLQEKWIEISFQKNQNIIQIVIVDSGPGIPDEVAARMMDPFYTTKEVGKGTGLGLSISKGIINDHGGKLWYDSSSGKTRFIIEMMFYS